MLLTSCFWRRDRASIPPYDVVTYEYSNWFNVHGWYDIMDSVHAMENIINPSLYLGYEKLSLKRIAEDCLDGGQLTMHY